MPVFFKENHIQQEKFLSEQEDSWKEGDYMPSALNFLRDVSNFLFTFFCGNVCFEFCRETCHQYYFSALHPFWFVLFLR